MRRFLTFLLSSLALLQTSAAFSQADLAEDPLRDSRRFELLTENLPEFPESQPQEGMTSALPYILDEETRIALGEEIYNNYLWTTTRNRGIYEWQDFSTRIIFWAVLFLVFTGIFFSGLQFFRGKKGKDGIGNAEEAISNVELSASGIKVSSPFLGVILLVVSMGFFYLYLVYVYPIS